jgi:hypothetical protein
MEINGTQSNPLEGVKKLVSSTHVPEGRVDFPAYRLPAGRQGRQAKL